MDKVTLEEAQHRLYEYATQTEIKRIRLDVAMGYVLAQDLLAQITQPPFIRSAMDGYAVRVEDVKLCTREQSVTLQVAGQVLAGEQARQSCQRGQAIRIMTGAPLPKEADLVIPQEYTDYGEDTVTIYQSGQAGENCVPMGEDFWCGDVLAAKGEPIDAYTIAAGIAGGVTEVMVYQKLRVALITTGTELVEAGGPLLDGQIYDSNNAFFKNRLLEMGYEVVYTNRISDDMQGICAIIREAGSKADLIVTTGGVSVGKKDFLPQVMDSIGARVLFQGIRIKPGMPTMAAGYQDKLILCLSGNPYSAIAMFETLLPYYEKKAQGCGQNRLRTAQAITTNSFQKRSPVRRLIRGVWDGNRVHIRQEQRNGQLRGGIGCNCLIDIPEGTEQINENSNVKIFYWIR